MGDSSTFQDADYILQLYFAAMTVHFQNNISPCIEVIAQALFSSPL